MIWPNAAPRTDPSFSHVASILSASSRIVGACENQLILHVKHSAWSDSRWRVSRNAHCPGRRYTRRTAAIRLIHRQLHWRPCPGHGSRPASIAAKRHRAYSLTTGDGTEFASIRQDRAGRCPSSSIYRSLPHKKPSRKSTSDGRKAAPHHHRGRNPLQDRLRHRLQRDHRAARLILIPHWIAKSEAEAQLSSHDTLFAISRELDAGGVVDARNLGPVFLVEHVGRKDGCVDL